MNHLRSNKWMSHVIDAVRQCMLVFGADAINSLTIRNTFSRERKFGLDQCNKLTKAVRIKRPITGTGLKTTNMIWTKWSIHCLAITKNWIHRSCDLKIPSRTSYVVLSHSSITNIYHKYWIAINVEKVWKYNDISCTWLRRKET